MAAHQLVVQPFGQIGAHARGQAGTFDRGQAVQPFSLFGVQERRQHVASQRGRQAQQRQAARAGAGAAFGKLRELHAPAQHRIDGLGDDAALAMAELAVLAEVVAHHGIGRAGEQHDLAEQAVDMLDVRGMQPAVHARRAVAAGIAVGGLADGAALALALAARRRVALAAGGTGSCLVAAHALTPAAGVWAEMAISNCGSAGLITLTTPSCSCRRSSTNQRTARG
ncbi:hypothetical protein D9M68_590540 [compost metagenome]